MRREALHQRRSKTETPQGLDRSATRIRYPPITSDMGDRRPIATVCGVGEISSFQPVAGAGRTAANLDGAQPRVRRRARWRFVGLLACVLLRPASVYSIMTHRHVNDLVRHHDHRRHCPCPTSDPQEHSAVRAGGSWVCIDRDHSPPAVAFRPNRQVGRQIDNRQCDRSI
jgi:hypothetical protein